MAYFGSSGIGGQYYRPSFFGGFSFFPPVIKWLLIGNTAIWLLMAFFLAPFTLGGMPVGGESGMLTRVLALWPIGEQFWPWQLFTYMFLHGGFGHLFFNMFALWMFGMELENLWGSKRFLTYYLACGLGGAVANLFVAPLLGQAAPTVGASGAVFGVLVAFGMLFPDRPIYLYFLLPVRAKYFISVYIALELFYGVTGSSSGVAHFAHLGGAAVGALYTFMLIRGVSFGDVWNQVRGIPANSYGSPRSFTGDDIRDAKFFDIHTGRPMEGEDELNQEVVDAILDKINRSGYQSLTDEEKKILSEASKKIH